MAKIQGPLLSFSAAGTVAGLLNFRTIGRGPIVQRAQILSPTPTPRQQDVTQRGAEAASSWRAMSKAERDEWRPIAQRRAIPIFAAYLAEYIGQFSNPYTPPRLPALDP